MGVNAKLSDLTAATTLAGDEQVYVVQGGNSRRTTVEDVVRNTIDAVVRVADRTALKALDVTKDVVATTYDDGDRNGDFAFVTSDLSTLVSADTQEGIYIAPNSDATGASGAWVRQGNWLGNGVSLEWFGATPIATWGTPEDSTTAIAGWTSLINALPVPTRLSDFYASTATVSITNNCLKIHGAGGFASGFVFQNCDGISMAPTIRAPDVSLSEFAIVTDSDALHEGFSFVGPASGTPGQIKKLSQVTFIGLDRLRLAKFGDASANTNEWLTCCYVENSERWILEGTYYQGAQTQLDMWTSEATAVSFLNTDQVLLLGEYAAIFQTAIKTREECEGINVVGGTYIGLFDGYSFQQFSTTGPANDHQIVNTHFDFENRGIQFSGEVGSRTAGAGLHDVRGCLLLAGSTAGNVSLVIATGHVTVHGNQFYTNNADPETVGSIGIEVKAGEGHSILGNHFTRHDRIVEVEAGVQRTMIMNNGITDPNAVTTEPVDDLGDSTFIDGNYGDRYNLWGGSITNLAPFMGKNAAFSITSEGAAAVNFVEVVAALTGNAVRVRPGSSSDTNVDMRVESRGTGRIDFRTSDTVRWSVLNDQRLLGQTGAAIAIGANQVIQGRETGWTASTGTANIGAYATHTAATISDPPTQTEVQAIADALEDASQRIKALEDALFTHGLIGA